MNSFWSACWKCSARLDIGRANGTVRCEPAWRWDIDEFTDFDLWIVLDGSGEMRLEEQWIPVSAGFSICFPPGCRSISARHDPHHPLQVFYCHFSLQRTSRQDLPDPPPAMPVMRDLNNAFHIILQRFNNTSADLGPLREVLLWELLLGHEDQSGATQATAIERLGALTLTIRENPAASYVVSELARKAGLSEGHFRRLFHQVTGCSPLQYILDCRIDRAQFYLRETRLPIQEIASTVGYSDVYYFSRHFKERTGFSPSSYRRIEAATTFNPPKTG